VSRVVALMALAATSSASVFLSGSTVPMQSLSSRSTVLTQTKQAEGLVSSGADASGAGSTSFSAASEKERRARKSRSSNGGDGVEKRRYNESRDL
jgi:uncharacterized low-complexity protein